MVTGNLRVCYGHAPEEEIGEEKGTSKGKDNYKKDWERGKMRLLGITMSKEGQGGVLVDEDQPDEFPESKTLSLWWVSMQSDEQKRSSPYIERWRAQLPKSKHVHVTSPDR